MNNSEQLRQHNLQQQQQKEQQQKEQQQKEQQQKQTEHRAEEKKQLLQHPDLWRAGQLRHTSTQSGISSGYELLDKQLPDHGWPNAGTVELLLASAGVGELRLLVPALKELSQTQERWIAWINPPFIPYAPALEAAGIDISKILLIHPQSHKDTLWSIERACRSGTCSCVMAWPDDKKLKLKDTQRLQVAAKQGRTLNLLFRPLAASRQTSMAELRIGLKPGAQTGFVQLDILKRRGGWPLSDLSLAIAATTHTTHRCHEEITEQLSLWRAQRNPVATPDVIDAPRTPALLPPVSRPMQTPIH